MALRRGITGLTALLGACSAFAGTVHVQFVGGSMHDPDGDSFGVAHAQTGFYQLEISDAGSFSGGDLRNGFSFLTFRLDLASAIVGGEHSFGVSTSMSMPNNAAAIPLASEVAYLYTQFRNGTLASTMSFDQGASGDLDALQDAIWHFQGLLHAASAGRLTDTSPMSDDQHAVMSARASEFIAAANAAVAGGWTGLGDVQIVTTSPLGDGDQTLSGNYLTLATPVVPLPGPVGLAIGGMLLAGAGRRRHA